MAKLQMQEHRLPKCPERLTNCEGEGEPDELKQIGSRATGEGWQVAGVHRRISERPMGFWRSLDLSMPNGRVFGGDF